MDHAEARRLNAAEQYLLGELPGDLHAQFEEHFMSCAECARDIRASVVFAESAREAFRSEGMASDRARSRGWFALLFRPVIAAPAFAVLLAIVVYQAGVTIPRLESSLSRANSPRALTSFSLINEDSRGGGPAAFTVPPDQPFALYVDVPPKPAFSMYTLEVENGSGTAQLAVPVSGDEARSTVEVFVPASRLGVGQYVLVIRGTSGSNSAQATEVARYRFSLAYGQPANSTAR